MHKNTLTKIVHLFVIIILGILIIGCSKNQGSNEPTHEHTPCPECGKCLALDCLSLEDRCQGHIHDHLICKDCGKCTDTNCPDNNICVGHIVSEEMQPAFEIFTKFESNYYLELGDSLELPSEKDGYVYSYEFDKPQYFDEDYKVIKDEKYDARVKLIVTAKKGEQSVAKIYNIYIYQNIDQYFQVIEKHIKDYIDTPHRGDFKLVTTYYKEDLTITHKSNRPDIIKDNGEYIEHIYDEEVTITTTIELRGHTHTFDINVVSIGLPFSEKLEVVSSWLGEYMSNLEISDLTKLPESHPEHGGRIRWICEDPMVIYDYKTIVLPKEAKTSHFIAEIHYGSVYEIVMYEVNLPARRQDITDLDRAKLFIETVTNTEYSPFINLYDGDAPEIDLTYLIDTSKANVNMTSGTHPEISQELLDELIYEGYQLENEENVLWVIIHETGSTTVNTGAEVHAQLQVNNSINGGREASWHYQVDDGKIYQSFTDDRSCWHASDSGKTPGKGNANGIGIEMCVNADAEYDVSMRNDARLVAHLLNKYKLSMLNIKQHYDMAPNSKPCPEQMRKKARWFEFLTLVTREYVSQQFLSEFDIEYIYDSEKLASRDIAGVYKMAEDLEELEIIVKINGEEFVIKVK